MTTKRSSSPYDLCNFVFANGSGCCMPAVPSLNGYCRSHGDILKPRPPAEHNEDLLQEIGGWPRSAFGTRVLEPPLLPLPFLITDR